MQKPQQNNNNSQRNPNNNAQPLPKLLNSPRNTGPTFLGNHRNIRNSPKIHILRGSILYESVLDCDFYTGHCAGERQQAGSDGGEDLVDVGAGVGLEDVQFPLGVAAVSFGVGGQVEGEAGFVGVVVDYFGVDLDFEYGDTGSKKQPKTKRNFLNLNRISLLKPKLIPNPKHPNHIKPIPAKNTEPNNIIGTQQPQRSLKMQQIPIIFQISTRKIFGCVHALGGGHGAGARTWRQGQVRWARRADGGAGQGGRGGGGCAGLAGQVAGQEFVVGDLLAVSQVWPAFAQLWQCYYQQACPQVCSHN